MRYRHVIWDWNGTIVDDVDLTVEITNIMLTRAGSPEISKETHCAVFQFPIADYYQAIGLPITPETLPAIDFDFHSTYHDARHRLAPFSDIATTLDLLTGRSCEHSILSALPHTLLLEHLKHLNLKTAFKHVIGRETTHAGSHAGSKVEAGRKLLKDLNLAATEVLIVGDTVYDHEVAAALGTDCALVARGHQNHERLRAVQPTFLASSLSELVQILKLDAE